MSRAQVFRKARAFLMGIIVAVAFVYLVVGFL